MGTIPAWLQSQTIKLAFVFVSNSLETKAGPHENPQTCARGSVICPPVMINNKDDKLATRFMKPQLGCKEL